VLSGFKAVKEGLVGYGEEFGGRTLSAFFSSQEKGRGIVFANGHIWKKQRQIGNSSLRLFGPGNKMIEHQIKEEAQQLIEIFTRTKGQPFDPSLPLINSVSNVICAFNLGHQFAHEDKNFQKLVENIICIKAIKSAEFILSFVRQEVESHKQYQSLHDPQDFIDFYLLQME
ncbi:putative Cytochrome P450 2J2-like protein, partial [Naja naja]